MARFFVPHSESDVRVLEQSPERVVLRIAWMPPAMRWKFFGIFAAVFAALLFFAAGPTVLLALAPSILFVLAINAWSYTLVEISPERICWRIIPFPARKIRKMKLDEAEALVFGQVYVRLNKRNKGTPTYGVALRKRNGKVWAIHDGFASTIVPLHIAKLLSGALPGCETESATIPEVKSASWQMLFVVLAIPALAALIAMIQMINS